MRGTPLMKRKTTTSLTPLLVQHQKQVGALSACFCTACFSNVGFMQGPQAKGAHENGIVQLAAGGLQLGDPPLRCRQPRQRPLQLGAQVGGLAPAPARQAVRRCLGVAQPVPLPLQLLRGQLLRPPAPFASGGAAIDCAGIDAAALLAYVGFRQRPS